MTEPTRYPFEDIASDIASSRENYGLDNYSALIESRLREAFAAGAEDYDTLAQALARHEAELRSSNSVCACGCPDSEHEGYDEDGESCSHDDHDCVRTNGAVLGMLQKLRAALAESEKARQQAEAEVERRKRDFVSMKATIDAADEKAEAETARRLRAEQERDDLSWRLKIQASDCVKAIEATKDAQSTLAERTRERDEARAVLSALAEVANLTRTPPLSGDAVAGHTRAILARFFKTHELTALKASGSPRIVELAKLHAFENHKLGVMCGYQNHLDIDAGADFNPGFEACDHPDCVLVRDASAHLEKP